ncbi:hypothetical protein chiPu_0031049, partial [Chiloscyllium punctatum]|nr:hypothetical protein [Chiloscyllium punctatum]
KAEDEPGDGRLQQRATCSSQTRSVPLNTLNRSTIESGHRVEPASSTVRPAAHQHWTSAAPFTLSTASQLRVGPSVDVQSLGRPHRRLNISSQLRVPKTKRCTSPCKPPTAILGPVTAVLAPLPRHRRTPGRAPHGGVASSLMNGMCRVRGNAKCSDAGGLRNMNLGGQRGRVLCGTPAALSPAKASAIDCQMTLRQAWPQEEPGLQSAFNVSMFNVSCNSH